MISSNRWIKASASNDTGSCIEMRREAGLIEVRDSKDAAAGPILRLSAAEFARWIGGAKAGEFDHFGSTRL